MLRPGGLLATFSCSGGVDAALFRKLRDAYEQLIDWSENPTFTSRRGFADKWFYEGGLDRWTQPAPVRQTVPEE